MEKQKPGLAPGFFHPSIPSAAGCLHDQARRERTRSTRELSEAHRRWRPRLAAYRFFSAQLHGGIKLRFERTRRDLSVPAPSGQVAISRNRIHEATVREIDGRTSILFGVSRSSAGRCCMLKD